MFRSTLRDLPATTLIVACLLLGLLFRCSESTPTASAAGRFAEPFHVFTSMTWGDDFSSSADVQAQDADPLDPTTFGTAQTPLNWLPQLKASPQNVPGADGWCDHQPLTIPGHFEGMVADQAIFLFNLPMDFVGLYLVFLPEGGAFAEDVEISAVVPIAAGGHLTIFHAKIKKDKINPAVYFGPGNYVKDDKDTSVVEASIRPVPDQELTLKVAFPKAGDYHFSLVAQNAAQQNIRR